MWNWVPLLIKTIAISMATDLVKPAAKFILDKYLTVHNGVKKRLKKS